MYEINEKLKNIAPCDVCMFQKDGRCLYHGKECREVEVCIFAPYAIHWYIQRIIT